MLPPRSSKFRLPIITHVNAVTRGVTAVATAAKQKGLDVNVKLVERAALLHDVAMHGRNIERDRRSKGVDRKIQERSGEKLLLFSHARSGAEILERHGYSEIARIIGRHGDRPVKAAEKYFSMEDRLLDLVDSRTRGNKFVSLDEKLEYLVERYGNWDGLPPGHKTPAAYKRYIKSKFNSLKRFQEGLTKKGVDVDKLLFGK